MRWLLALALVASPAAAQIDPSNIGLIGIAPTGTPLNLGDDATQQVQLGFTFDYFGQQFSQAWVSSNGFVSFANIGNLCCDGWPIENAPRNAVYASWSDLISGSNPYAQTVTIDGQKIFVAGWYNTQEYGSWRPNTFEIQLYESGMVNIAYGTLNNQYHTVTAGIAGPTYADSYLIYYGQNVTSLSNTSWSYGASAVVDCNATPLDPSCPPITLAFSPVVTSSPVAEIAQADDVAVEAAVDEPTAAVEAVAEVVTVTEAATEPVPVEQVTEVRVEAEAKAEKQEVKAERLSPAQLAAMTSGKGVLAALLPSQVLGDAQVQESTSQAAQEGQQSETKQADAQQAAQDGELQAVSAQQEASTTSEVQQAVNASEMSSGGQEYSFTAITPQPSEQLRSESKAVMLSDMSNPAFQLQILEMMNAKQEEQSKPAATDAEMQKLGGNVSLAQYAQARIPDAQFYNEREIYRRNRPVDAYLVMYRLMMNNDRRWLEMIGQQYER